MRYLHLKLIPLPSCVSQYFGAVLKTIIDDLQWLLKNVCIEYYSKTFYSISLFPSWTMLWVLLYQRSGEFNIFRLFLFFRKIRQQEICKANFIKEIIYISIKILLEWQSKYPTTINMVYKKIQNEYHTMFFKYKSGNFWNTR